MMSSSCGKDGTQEEFFHTFNELLQNDKQIVLTSDRAPKAIPAIEKDWFLALRPAWWLMLENRILRQKLLF